MQSLCFCLSLFCMRADALRLPQQAEADPDDMQGASLYKRQEEQFDGPTQAKNPPKIHKLKCPSDDEVEQQHPINSASEHYQGTTCWLNSIEQKSFLMHLKHEGKYCVSGLASPAVYLAKHGSCPDSLWHRGKHLTQRLGRVLKEDGVNELIEGQNDVFTGDSFGRQLFVALVSAFRTAEHAMDFNSHKNARYETTNSEDELQLQIEDPAALANYSKETPNAYSANYLWDSDIFNDRGALQKYLAALSRSAGHVDNLVMVPSCTWQTSIGTGDDFKKKIKSFACATGGSQTGCAKQISIVGYPTEHLPESFLHRCLSSNKAISLWTKELSSEGVNTLYIDFDSHIANTPGGTVSDAGGNWHYMCQVMPNMEKVNAATRDLWPREDGTCLFRQGNPNVQILKQIFSTKE